MRTKERIMTIHDVYGPDNVTAVHMKDNFEDMLTNTTDQIYSAHEILSVG